MTLLPAFLRSHGPRGVDGGLILALVANVLLLGAAALAWATGQPIDLTSPLALACGAVVLVQTVLLAALVRRHARRAAERRDVESHVEAVGSDGPIRLDPDTVRAESALGARAKAAADLSASRRLAAAVIQAAAQAHTAAAAPPPAGPPEGGSNISHF